MTKHALDLGAWRRPSYQEMLEYLDDHGKKGRHSKSKHLVVRHHLRPVDVYCYLHSRFGEPIGPQMALRSDSSDNWAHWDFLLKSGPAFINIVGASRDIRFHLSEKLTDEDWKSLLLGIKSDFARVARFKAEKLKALEKYVVFPNKYKMIADICAELHEAITNAPAFEALPQKIKSRSDLKHVQKQADQASKRARGLYNNCLQLRMLTPIMAEAFINFLFLSLCKETIKNDRIEYDRILRLKIPERLSLLPESCDGFVRKVDSKSDAYRAYLRVVNKRNDLLHGNIDPIRDQVDTIFFDGNIPLFCESDWGPGKDMAIVEKLFEPSEVAKDYELVHEFLFDLLSCLDDDHQKGLDYIMGDRFPGYDVRKRRVANILPDASSFAMFPGERSEDDLKVEWS